jgi:hypothetical protein
MIEYDYWHFVLPPYEKREMHLQAMEGYAEFGRLAAPNPNAPYWRKSVRQLGSCLLRPNVPDGSKTAVNFSDRHFCSYPNTGHKLIKSRHRHSDVRLWGYSGHESECPFTAVPSHFQTSVDNW